MRFRGVGAVIVFAAMMLGGACSDRVIDGAVDSHLDEQPDGPNELYANCEHQSECGDLDSCVFPEGEEGFCSINCDSAEVCEPSPGGSAQPTCVSVGTGAPRDVCALDCGGDRTCPSGMVCREVATNDGDKRICF